MDIKTGKVGGMYKVTLQNYCWTIPTHGMGLSFRISGPSRYGIDTSEAVRGKTHLQDLILSLHPVLILSGNFSDKISAAQAPALFQIDLILSHSTVCDDFTTSPTDCCAIQV